MKTVVDELIETLDHLVTVYRHLLDIVRREHDVLLAATLDDLSEINRSKEKMVFKIKQLENQWLAQAKAVAVNHKVPPQQVTLLQLSQALGGNHGKRLHSLRTVLNMLVHRIAEINRKNATLAQSAIAHINGAMRAISETLQENPTYRAGGEIREDHEVTAGRLLAKEA